MTTSNQIMQGMRGAFGGKMVFRTLRGKTVISAMPKRLNVKPKDQSAAQRLTRVNFKSATYYAKHILQDPRMKEYYQRMAEKLKLPNAYTAAITDHMRKAKVESLDTKKYTGKPGGQVALSIRKKDFAVKEVTVTLRKKTGETIEKGAAVKNGPNVWVYRNTTEACAEDVHLVVEMKEGTGRTITWTTEVAKSEVLTVHPA